MSKLYQDEQQTKIKKELRVETPASTTEMAETLPTLDEATAAAIGMRFSPLTRRFPRSLGSLDQPQARQDAEIPARQDVEIPASTVDPRRDSLAPAVPPKRLRLKTAFELAHAASSSA